MIILEVEVPMMGKKYDFQIDETVLLYEVKEEIVEMICRKEQCLLTGEIDQLMIWTAEGTELSQEYTAQENGLRTGSHVLLI